MKERENLSYKTTPRYKKRIQEGFKPVKEYETFWLFEKEQHGKVLYRECFHKFELFGSDWAVAPNKRKKSKYD